MRIDILGVGFDDVTVRQALSMAGDVISGGENTYIVTPNPEIVWSARRDEGLRKALAGAGLVLADGIGIILAARILGTPIKEKIPGIDFAESLLAILAKSGGGVFLLGAKPGIAEEAGRRLAAAYPGLVVKGAADGYFTEDEPVIRQINDACPELLLVGLGSPKQEMWMAENLGRLDARLCIGVGGSLDVYAGASMRAPESMQRLGLEWLYRLIREPRRIKRMIKLPLFVLAAILKRVRG